MKAALPAQKDGPRINEEIRSREVQLIDATGDNKGIVATETAIGLAQAAGLDLVEIAPNSTPPVAKILDYGKYKFQAQKKAAEARKKQKVVEIKEIKLRPMIDDHDYQVKMRSMQRFFEEGDKVKITLRFRGREMAHQELGYKLLQRVKELDPTMFTKSGIMVGLGEERNEVLQLMDDLRTADVDFLTIGQYLQPTRKHHKVDRFVTPEEFKSYETVAYTKGFLMVSSSPLTRSSHHAGDDFARLRAAREKKLLAAAE